jgi:Tol biopolymer transport system component
MRRRRCFRREVKMLRSGSLVVLLVTLGAATGSSGDVEAQVEQSRDDVWLFDTSGGRWDRLLPRSEAGRVSGGPSMSADGTLLVFHSNADFLGEGLPATSTEIWLFDIERRELSRITSASDTDRSSTDPTISADGSTVVFESDADFRSEGIVRGQRELWRYSVADGELTRLTRDTTGVGVSRGAALSADGSTLAFHSNIPFGTTDPPGRTFDVWLMDLGTGRLTSVSRSLGPGRNSVDPAISADGTRVTFQSDADVGRASVSPGQFEIWLFDSATEELERLTVSGDATRSSESPSISADGTRIVFHSDADLLAEGRPDSVDEIWIYDTNTESLTRITSTWVPERDARSNPVLHPDAQDPLITAEGSRVVFASDADFLDEGLPNGYPNVWLYDVGEESLTRIGLSDGRGSGAAIDADASRIVTYRSRFDFIRESRIAIPAPAPLPERLSFQQMERDLEAFRLEIEGRWAYLEASDVDYVSVIDALLAEASDGMDFDDYSVAIQRIISLFIDGHAGASPVRYEPGFLPFLIESTGGRFVAFRPDRSSFVDPERPFVVAVDGRPISEWIDAAAPFNPRGSTQFIERHALRQVRYLRFQRRVMGIEDTDEVSVELTSARGLDASVVELPVSAQGPTYGLWPRTQSGILDGNVGYLRIVSMNDDAVAEVQR